MGRGTASMTKVKPLAAIVGLITGLASTMLAAEVRWYLAHMGAETCVPLDDIGDNNERLYYGAGDMHTPADVARQIVELGGTIKLMPSSSESFVTYMAKKPGDTHYT
jgi:hypothetical protein